jgi:hypothetical protein
MRERIRLKKNESKTISQCSYCDYLKYLNGFGYKCDKRSDSDVGYGYIEDRFSIPVWCPLEDA